MALYLETTAELNLADSQILDTLVRSGIYSNGPGIKKLSRAELEKVLGIVQESYSNSIASRRTDADKMLKVMAASQSEPPDPRKT